MMLELGTKTPGDEPNVHRMCTNSADRSYPQGENPLKHWRPRQDSNLRPAV